MDKLQRTFTATPEDKKKAEVPSRLGHLVVKRKEIFVSRWPLRGANSEGHARFLRHGRGERDGARRAGGGEQADGDARQRALLRAAFVGVVREEE
jgi:hypothetical protein